MRGNLETLREARRLLDQLEALWRARIDRIDEILAEPSDPILRKEPHS